MAVVFELGVDAVDDDGAGDDEDDAGDDGHD